MYGTQTHIQQLIISYQFENDVKMYGTQTELALRQIDAAFENDVKMYGTQTNSRSKETQLCLRMM